MYNRGPEIDPDYRDIGGLDQTAVDAVSAFIRAHMPMLEDQPSIVEPCIYTVSVHPPNHVHQGPHAYAGRPA